MKFTISIITHSALAQAKRCIQSVLEHSPKDDIELILTANRNPAVSEAFRDIGFLFKHCRVVENTHNLGFIEPNKTALEMASGRYFVMLNDDATVPEGWLDALEAPFLTDQRCAVTGPVGCVLNKEFVGYHCTQYPEYIEGSCLCVRTDIARQFGLFAPYLSFAYCEDADLCLRLREAGFTVRLADFKLQHTGSSTSSLIPGIREMVLPNFVKCRDRWAEYLGSNDRLFPVESVK